MSTIEVCLCMSCTSALAGVIRCPTGIKVVTNAGGINVAACAEALKTIANEKGIDLNIATITGDDLIPNVSTVPFCCLCVCASHVLFCVLVIFSVV